MRNVVNLIIFAVVVLILFYVGILAIGFYLSPQDSIKKADAIVVISGGETYSRTVEGINLYQSQYAPLLIFSGAALDPESPSNAKVMQDVAINEFLVPAQDVIIEENSNSTYENALNLKPIFEQYNIKSIILVTSPYHQLRSKMTFQDIMGSDFVIMNHSAKDDLWRKLAWWQNDKAVSLTLSELWKIIYIKVTGKYQYNS